ncbi:E3 ubiquitin-protein ligase TRIM33-like [Antedon mediterranea]|uniref:E3 ubiquitin-protein ligase TRIM33-like n=1 Tax=Antedon mediterranea TaxID=105859 RepID=UPI003AF55509
MDHVSIPSCPICKQELASRQPKLMPCLHTVCKTCILVIPDTSTSRCPVCNQECRNSTDIIDDYFIISAAIKSETNKETLCTSCEDSAEATSYCQDCQEWLCDACVQAHFRVRVTKDHIISRKTDAERALARVGDKPLFCPNHKQEQLQLYCETCDRLTCRDCQLLYHKEHKYQFVSEASARHKSSLKVLVNKLGEKQQTITKTKDTINVKVNEVNKKQEHTVRNIQNLTSKIVLEINESARRSIAELSTQCDKKRSMLSLQMQEAVKLEKILQHCLKFTSQAVQSSSNIALLQTKKQIIKQLILVLRTGCTRLPVTGLDINYLFNLTSQSLSQIRNFGTLVVKEQPLDTNHQSSTAPNPHLKAQPNFSLAMGHNRGSYPMQAVAPIHLQRTTVTTLPQTSQAIQMLSQTKNHTNARFAGIHNSNLVHNPLYRERVDNLIPKERLNMMSHVAPVQSTNNSSPGARNSSASASPNAPLIEPKKEPTSPVQNPPATSPFVVDKPDGQALPRENQAKNSENSSDSGVTFAPIRIENVVSLQVKGEVKSEETSSCAMMAKTGSQPPPPSSNDLPSTSSIDIQGPSFSIDNTVDSIFTTKPTFEAPTKTVPQKVGLSSSQDSNDPNEDWCAVCKNGGDLLCCDSCPRVFHLNCHIPTLPDTPSDAFECTLCKNFEDDDETETINGSQKRKVPDKLSQKYQAACERILLELFCHPSSYPFHEPVDRTVPNYYKVISKPMELVTIKEKLKPTSGEQYETLDDFVEDVKLMFSNCLLFNGETSDIGRVARNIERFFLKQLKKFFPDYTDDMSSNYQEDRFNKRKRRPQDILHIK